MKNTSEYKELVWKKEELALKKKFNQNFIRIQWNSKLGG